MIKGKNSLTLVELIVSLGIFLIIALSVWQGYYYLTELIRLTKIRNIAVALVNEQLEIIRNLPYADVGIVDGIPRGKLPRNRQITRNKITFDLLFTIRNIDDPFDELFPNDLSPADYKLVEVKISCSNCQNFPPLEVTTTVAPKNLETATNNGALFIRVINANGQPVAQANVHIVNNQANPPININETTDNNGWLQIVDIPSGVEAYEISVSKAGYSEEKTYKPGQEENPNPIKPHVTVIAQQVTQVSFVIDKISTLNISSSTETCSRRGNIDFLIKGTKLIGQNPDVYKYNQSYLTDSSGHKTISNLEWDNYSITLTDQNYHLAGSLPLFPFNLNPDTTQNLFLIVKPKLPKALLIKVRDAVTGLPLSGAQVTLEKTDYKKTLLSGQGYLRQTDWSGGQGQENFEDETKYSSQDGNLEIDNPAGEIKLVKINNEYQTSGWLISSTLDTGGISNFYNIYWQPLDQPPSTEIKFQIATSTLPTPENWNFKGPDGTANTYFTLANTNIHSSHNGDRYFRYKVFLSTDNLSVTPSVAEIATTFSSACIPSGQTFFNNLSSGNYDLTVTLDGYQNFNESIEILSDWQEKNIVLNPE